MAAFELFTKDTADQLLGVAELDLVLRALGQEKCSKCVNPLVPNAPLMARVPLWTSIAIVLKERKINGECLKVGRPIKHHLQWATPYFVIL